MSTGHGTPVYSDGGAYDRGGGRWSRLFAQQFVPWLGVRRDARWLDVACGTGALAGAVMDMAWPGALTGVDQSAAYLEQARRLVAGAAFEPGDAEHLPFPDAAFDAVVCGLALPYFQDPMRAITEMTRVAAPGGVIATYLWDDVLHHTRFFWEAALEVGAAEPWEDERAEPFDLADPTALAKTLSMAGLREPQNRELLAEITYGDFDELWSIYTSGQGHTGAYCMALTDRKREAVREALRTRLPPARDGRIHVMARAWATKARR